MSDLDNISEVINETVQPADSVDTSTEESQGTPQPGDTEQELFFADDEGDQNQPNSNMTNEQTRAAWHKERDKRKRKQQEIDDGVRREKDLNDRIASLESAVTTVSKGAKPTMDSCGYDEANFEAAMDEWYKSPQSAPQSQPEQQQQQTQVNDEADFNYYQSSSELKEKLSDYADYEAKAKASFAQYGGNPDEVISNISMIAKQTGSNVANAVYAFGRSPALVAELNNAAATGNQFAIAEVIKKAAGKIQTRERKQLDTKPTPTINSGGAIDNQTASVKKAMDQYAETGSTADYLKLVAARKK